MARKHPVTARLNGSVGDSLAVAFGLLLEDIDVFSATDLSFVIPGRRNAEPGIQKYKVALSRFIPGSRFQRAPE
jgi:hypothetical protein